MLKKALFVLGSAVLVLAIAGCDGGPDIPSADTANLPEGMEPFKPPDPGAIETKPAPGSAHQKSSSSDQQ